MSINSKIFKAYDVRGLYPEEIDEKAVYAIARAAAQFMFRDRDSKHSMVVAMDNRASSPSLKKAVLDALGDAGVNVIDAGVATTPMFYFAVNRAKADGGIMVTASHNPPQYNGCKITSHEARPVGENSGLADIKRLAEAGSPRSSSGEAGDFQKTYADSSFAKRDYLEEYVDFLLKDVSIPKTVVVADASCGYSGVVLSEVAKRAGLQLKTLCFPPCETMAHEADPLKDENIQDIVASLKSGAGDFGVALDGDGDRIFFFDKSGERVPSHIIGSLLARHYLKQQPGATIISDVRMPKVFAETVLGNGGRYLENRVGHAFIKQRMREEGAVFAAEVSGHFYFKDFFGMDSGIFTFTRVLNIIASEGKPLEELAASYRKRFQSGELNYKVADVPTAISALKMAFADAEKFSEIDGLSIFYPDWWFNVRPSNTEPFLRANIEAETEELLKERQRYIAQVIASL